jgi:phosphatidylserine decarboxylase
MRTLIEKLLAGLQYILPQRLLTALVFRLMRCQTPWLKNALIRSIASLAGVDWEEAASRDLADYPSFNAFFTRELKPGARPLDADPRALLSPSDGRISELGQITGDQIFQAKGHEYSLAELLADDPSFTHFQGGHFCTIYLSPRDYHRVHMPLSGELQRMIHVPGKLFSVAPYTVRQVPRLFARNERVVSIFETTSGPFAQVLVGAMLVASMDTVWAGTITPATQRVLSRQDYEPGTVRLERGAEMGRFNMGSTVILIAAPGALTWSTDLHPGDPVRMGQRIATLT